MDHHSNFSFSIVLQLSHGFHSARSFFTLTHTHNKTFLNNNKYIFFSSHSNAINHKRYFNNFFSLKFWSTKKSLKPVSSNPQNFFDTSINKPTSNLSITTLPTSNLPAPTPTPTPTSITPISHPPVILNFTPNERNKFILNYGGSGIPKSSDKLISAKNDENYYSIGCGEDSFFSRYDSLGVADGVGGWRNVASIRNFVADSALYARKLMHYSYAELEKYDNVEDEKYYHYNEANPVDILQASYEQTIKTLDGVVGSSTALIAILRDDELRIANLGDCGIGVIRYNDYIFRNEEQQHSFNYPYQLGTGSLNTPKNDAQQFTIKIQQGDIIIMGSDGIFDNLFEEDILEEIKDKKKIDPQMLSDTLAWKAKQASVDLNIDSPFQSRALQEGLPYQGGKRDDISVLVAVVTDNLDKDIN
ncbi:phosphatase 2C-like domain-containing protein [Glomus cerebriforme]|uniref:Protein phosphatase n=1 Tax=Glomus cerebriforme TaxID=658196 RepID=A0A397S3M3_9GLOM|nr:phosphatase 2C-like domain-containing protein [Glomus cerebriforme]